MNLCRRLARLEAGIIGSGVWRVVESGAGTGDDAIAAALAGEAVQPADRVLVVTRFAAAVATPRIIGWF